MTKSPTRHPNPFGRLSVAQGMLAVAVLALGLGLWRSTGAFWAALNLAVILMLGRWVLSGPTPTLCSQCGRGRLGLMAAVPFRHDYYQCSDCGARLKRSIWGPWSVAKGPRDDARYRRRSEEGRWLGAPTSLSQDGPQGHLLQVKRQHERTLPTTRDDWQAPPATEPPHVGPAPPDPQTIPDSDGLETSDRLLRGKRRRQGRS